MILAFIEQAGQAPTALSLEVLTMASRLAHETRAPLEAVVIGPAGGSIAHGLGTYGVSALHVADDPRLEDYAPVAWARAIAELAEKAGPEIVIGTASDRGSDVMAHVAARMALPLAANCTEFLPGDPLLVTRQRWGGSLPQYAVGHVAHTERIRADVATQPGLAVCGAAYDGVGIAACVASAHRAAQEVTDPTATQTGDHR